MKKWKFELGANAIIETSCEHGVVIGRAEYPVDEDRFLIRYTAGDCRAVEAWWPVSALIAEEKPY